MPWAYVISDLNGEDIVRTLDINELQEKNQRELRIEKVINRKSDELYVKQKGYDNSFNNSIDRKDINIYNELFSKTTN